MNKLTLVIQDKPVATIKDTPENWFWLITWFILTEIETNTYKIEKR